MDGFAQTEQLHAPSSARPSENALPGAPHQPSMAPDEDLHTAGSSNLPTDTAGYVDLHPRLSQAAELIGPSGHTNDHVDLESGGQKTLHCRRVHRT